MVGQRSGSSPCWVRLPSDLVKRCHGFAQLVVDAYARGDNQNSHAYSYRDADKNVTLWQAAKMAECVFALEQGLDPAVDLNWSNRPDRYDVLLRGKRIEIKSSHPRAQYLICSVAKNGLFDQDSCDIFVMTKINLDYGVGYSVGWITKQEFATAHLVAGPDHPKLDEGTWYVELASLHAMDKLIEPTAAERAGYANGFVGYDSDGHFIHFCACGNDAGFGVGVFLRQDKLGTWYCRDCKPKEQRT